MDDIEIKYVIEAALLAAGRPLTIERLSELFTAKSSAVDRATLKRVLDALAADYRGRGIELAEVSSGYRIQVKRALSDWLIPLWEEKAPRYTRALLERNWVRVVGHRDVPGKPAMFGTTREFLDYFGLKKLEDLPPLAELKGGLPELSPQTDLIDSLEAAARGELPPAAVDADLANPFEAEPSDEASHRILEAGDDENDSTLPNFEDLDTTERRADAAIESARVIPLRASNPDTDR